MCPKREVSEHDLFKFIVSLEADIVITCLGCHEVRATQLDMAKYSEKTRSMHIFSFLLYTKKEYSCSPGFLYIKLDSSDLGEAVECTSMLMEFGASEALNSVNIHSTASPRSELLVSNLIYKKPLF
jgi:hypothetical protein